MSGGCKEDGGDLGQRGFICIELFVPHSAATVMIFNFQLPVGILLKSVYVNANARPPSLDAST